MNKGIFDQIQDGNITQYKNLSKESLQEAIDYAFFIKPEQERLKKLVNILIVSSEKRKSLLLLINSDLKEDLVLAKEIIDLL